jgi:hypothetical protein
MSIYEIVKKIIGSIEPYGDTNIDKERNTNINEYGTLACELVNDLINTARFKDRPENSIRKMGESAYFELKVLKDLIDHEID